MNRKKSQKKKGTGTKAKAKTDMPSGDIRATEKVMTDLTALLNEQQFGSIEDAESFLNNLLGSGKMPSTAKTTALQQAQELIYDAFDVSGKKRVALARQALELCSDCTDAYVLLAQEAARSLDEAKDLYEQGVKAGERALGPNMFKNEAGFFWGILETRPYMRARAGLAECLWMLGNRQEAIEHYQDMLRLNPNDNQGIRYIFANCLLYEGQERSWKNFWGSMKMISPQHGVIPEHYCYIVRRDRVTGHKKLFRRRRPATVLSLFICFKKSDCRSIFLIM
jgi:tetratricopeptide (TPR) repeat protein